MSLALIAALPFLGALLPGLMIRAGRNACALVTGSFTALALLGVLLHLPAVMRGEVITARFEWLPGLGLNANFMLDGLGLLGYEAVIRRDYPVVLGSLYLFTLIALVVKLVSDLLYMVVDPRVQFGSVGK